MCTSTRRTASQPTSPETVREHPQEINHPAEEEQQPASDRSNNGRDARGRFTANNPGGPGNPFARQVAALRAALVRRVTEEDIEQIASELVTQAKLGNLAASKLPTTATCWALGDTSP